MTKSDSNNTPRPTGDVSTEDLRVWLHGLADEERQEIKRTWNLSEMGRAAEPGPAEVAEVWTELMAQLDGKTGLTSEGESSESGGHPLDHGSDRLPLSRINRMSRAIRLHPAISAAAVLLIAVSSVLFLQMSTVTLEGIAGGDTSYLLPDGSSVSLATGSSLTYRRGFWGGGRTTRLIGEGFFEVQEANGSFKVETFNAAITVLGTRFNVRSWPEDHVQETVVALEEGSVELAPLNWPDNSISLEPGQLSRVLAGARNPSIAESVVLDRVLAWRNGGFYFKNAPLAVIVEEIERRYGVAIRVPTRLSDTNLAFFHDDPGNVEVLLDAIQAVTGNRYRVTVLGYEFLSDDN